MYEHLNVLVYFHSEPSWGWESQSLSDGYPTRWFAVAAWEGPFKSFLSQENQERCTNSCSRAMWHATVCIKTCSGSWSLHELLCWAALEQHQCCQRGRVALRHTFRVRQRRHSCHGQHCCPSAGFHRNVHFNRAEQRALNSSKLDIMWTCWICMVVLMTLSIVVKLLTSLLSSMSVSSYIQINALENYPSNLSCQLGVDGCFCYGCSTNDWSFSLSQRHDDRCVG